MTRYDSSAWVTKANKRKAYRDHVRDKFFSEVGATKNANAQGTTGAPQSQSSVVEGLLKLTAKGDLPDTGQKDMIDIAIKALSGVSLGAGEMGGTAQTQALLRQYSMKELRDNWFWAPAFFD